jgi:hypothetical protein
MASREQGQNPTRLGKEWCFRRSKSLTVNADGQALQFSVQLGGVGLESVARVSSCVASSTQP